MALDLDAIKGRCDAVHLPLLGELDHRTLFGGDRAFVAHAHTDVLALVDEIERLTVENRRLHARLNRARGHLHLAVAALCAPAEEGGGQ